MLQQIFKGFWKGTATVSVCVCVTTSPKRKMLLLLYVAGLILLMLIYEPWLGLDNNKYINDHRTGSFKVKKKTFLLLLLKMLWFMNDKIMVWILMTLANNKLGITEWVSKQKHTSFFRMNFSACVFVCERFLSLPYINIFFLTFFNIRIICTLRWWQTVSWFQHSALSIVPFYGSLFAMVRWGKVKYLRSIEKRMTLCCEHKITKR